MKQYVGATVIPSIIIYTQVIDRYTYAPDHCWLEKKKKKKLSSVWGIKIYVLKFFDYRLKKLHIWNIFGNVNSYPNTLTHESVSVNERKGNYSCSHMHTNVKDRFRVKVLIYAAFQFKFPIFSTFIFIYWKSLIRKFYSWCSDPEFSLGRHKCCLERFWVNVYSLSAKTFSIKATQALVFFVSSKSI